MHNLLKGEGLVHNKKKTYRIYKEEGLQMRTKRRKKLSRSRLVMETPQHVNECWSMDFVHDQLSNGWRFRVLNILDDFNRELVGQLVSFSISGQHVSRFLTQLSVSRRLPKQLVCDNVRIRIYEQS